MKNANLVITEDGIKAINTTLGDLVLDSGARAALLVGTSGQLIAAQGETAAFDTLSFAALSIGSFNSTKAIASLLGEAEFKRMFQQGHGQSLFMESLESTDVLAVVFGNQIPVGKIKFKVEQVLEVLNRQLAAMYHHTPASPFRAAPQAAPKINDLF